MDLRSAFAGFAVGMASCVAGGVAHASNLACDASVGLCMIADAARPVSPHADMASTPEGRAYLAWLWSCLICAILRDTLADPGTSRLVPVVRVLSVALGVVGTVGIVALSLPGYGAPLVGMLGLGLLLDGLPGFRTFPGGLDRT